MIPDSLDFAATFLGAAVVGQWLSSIMAILLVQRIVHAIRKNLL